MSRILLILGILFLAWMGYRFLNKTWSTRVKEVEKKARQDSQQQPKAVQQVKSCAYCKVHIPEAEGIYKDKQFFCSYQHLDSYLDHKK
ncbi:PP0621 family protein [sulfur-oxidizing endosymbiont of Gigantopelta aegis]|uniref:PP0621 family protein n=1 Tax=sulfur-oxidizing endosymbiont of Gigantopelta aegis TaxID=2794934 RepID=UPI0018DB5E60|nr:PP0621 family protein [sulfur-oxidizing endosymbiont of Gigantopelta aegis]